MLCDSSGSTWRLIVKSLLLSAPRCLNVSQKENEMPFATLLDLNENKARLNQRGPLSNLSQHKNKRATSDEHVTQQQSSKASRQR